MKNKLKIYLLKRATKFINSSFFLDDTYDYTYKEKRIADKIGDNGGPL